MIDKGTAVYEPVGMERTVTDLTKLDESELLALRARIDQILPVKNLADTNLEQELMMQLRAAQALQGKVLEDDHIPANQKAQVMNAISNTIQNLVKMQLDYYTPERLKKIENALVRTLNSWELSDTEEFFKRYEEILQGI